MKKESLLKQLLAICLLTGFVGANAKAGQPAPAVDKRDEGDSAEEYLVAQTASSKAQAAHIAKSRHGGKVLSVRKSGEGWKVKLLLDSGRIKMVYVDRATESQ